MNFYEGELKALRRSGRYRQRVVANLALKDFASNDYLGIAHNKQLHKLASEELSKLDINSSKASMLVNGYHKVHYEFEQALCKANGFEDAIVMGSGFNANIALMEALCRRGDILFMDELYHASGVLATHLRGVKVVFFKHNDMVHLKELFKIHKNYRRVIIAVEGIYSMDGDLCDKEVFEIADIHNAILVVDEAHSSGVVGKRLMGVFEHYDIKIQPNHIKMGTLGKAYGSFGAFILASSHIVEYLVNRAKPLIYATALSLYDTLLAHNALKYILQNKERIKKDIALRQKIIYDEFEISVDGLIVPIVIADNKKVLLMRDKLQELGFCVGAIRQPTVNKAIIRLIARTSQSESDLKDLCTIIKKLNVSL